MIVKCLKAQADTTNCSSHTESLGYICTANAQVSLSTPKSDQDQVSSTACKLTEHIK